MMIALGLFGALLALLCLVLAVMMAIVLLFNDMEAVSASIMVQNFISLIVLAFAIAVATYWILGGSFGAA